jgi:hypothetical protein
MVINLERTWMDSVRRTMACRDTTPIGLGVLGSTTFCTCVWCTQVKCRCRQGSSRRRERCLIHLGCVSRRFTGFMLDRSSPSDASVSSAWHFVERQKLQWLCFGCVMILDRSVVRRLPREHELRPYSETHRPPRAMQDHVDRPFGYEAMRLGLIASFFRVEDPQGWK